MATTEIHEGVKKDVTLNVTRDTSGETIELWAFDKGDETAEGVNLGSAQGAPSGEDIEFRGIGTHQLKADREYLVEAWINAETEDRVCLHPADNDDEIFSVRDRRRVQV